MNEIPKSFLAATDVVDWKNAAVTAQAVDLAAGYASDRDIAAAVFDWVESSVEHSFDYQRETVTCSASEVLAEGTGICYAKSHLLAALLRANGVPAGFCYQRLRYDETSDRFSLHGFNAVHLSGYGWYRVDARGNKNGVAAEFNPPVEKLAFPTSDEGEIDFPQIFADPLPTVVDALRTSTDAAELLRRLPDTQSLPSATC